MDFAVISRGDEVSEAKKEQVIEYLNGQGYTYNPMIPEVVIAVGGDGTVLQAYHTYKQRLDKTAFIAYNTGHLGFYSDWDTVESLLAAIVGRRLITVEYPLVAAEIEAEGQTVVYQALNDITIKGAKGSVQIDVQLNGHHFESFKGDGLCISSPSGSTGYNKSLGGAIVHPSLEMIQLSEMASINNRVYRTIGSSLVIPKHHILTLLPKEDTYMLSVDHESFPMDSIQHMKCYVGKEKIRFLRCRSFPFWNRVKEAFISLNDCEPRGGRE